MFKFKITPDRHNAVQILNYCLLPDPPLFSLPSTFKHSSIALWKAIMNNPIFTVLSGFDLSTNECLKTKK
jgi:hypothetical protein